MLLEFLVDRLLFTFYVKWVPNDICLRVYFLSNFSSGIPNKYVCLNFYCDQEEVFPHLVFDTERFSSAEAFRDFKPCVFSFVPVFLLNFVELLNFLRIYFVLSIQ